MRAEGLLAALVGLCISFTMAACAGPRAQARASRENAPSVLAASQGAEGTRVDVYVTQAMAPQAGEDDTAMVDPGGEEMMGRLPPSLCPVERGATVTLHRVRDMPAIDFEAAEPQGEEALRERARRMVGFGTGDVPLRPDEADEPAMKEAMADLEPMPRLEPLPAAQLVLLDIPGGTRLLFVPMTMADMPLLEQGLKRRVLAMADATCPSSFLARREVSPGDR